MPTAARSLAIPLSVHATGLVCSVGLSSPAAAAAVRAGIKRFSELPFHDRSGQPIIGAPVPKLSAGLLGVKRLYAFAESAVRACLDDARPTFGESTFADMPILLALGDSCGTRRVNSEDESPLTAGPGYALHRNSRVFGLGELGFYEVLCYASEMLAARRVAGCLVVAADSYIGSHSLAELERGQRLKTPDQSDGIIPSEGASAAFVTASDFVASWSPRAYSEICGIGFGYEPPGEHPGTMNRADGLTAALNGACRQNGKSLDAIDWRVAGITGERVQFMESSIAVSRLLKQTKDPFPLKIPAESLGDMGAALPGALLAIAVEATRRNYAPGDSAILFSYAAALRSPNRAACIVRANQSR